MIQYARSVHAEPYTGKDLKRRLQYKGDIADARRLEQCLNEKVIDGQPQMFR